MTWLCREGTSSPTLHQPVIPAQAGIQSLTVNPLGPPLMGDDKRRDLRDTLKLPAAFRCTVPPADPSLAKNDSREFETVILEPPAASRTSAETAIALCRYTGQSSGVRTGWPVFRSTHVQCT